MFLNFRACAVTLFVCAAPCLAQSSPVVQTRTMNTTTSAAAQLCTPDKDTGSAAAPAGFAPWNETLVVMSSMCDGTLTSTLTQQSTISPSQIHAGGSAGFVQSEAPSDPTFIATGDNHFSYTFHVPDQTTYRLIGTWSGAGTANSVRSFQFSGPDGVIVSSNGTAPFSRSGTLTPGDYTLEAMVSYDYQNVTSLSAASGVVGFSFNLSMPPPIQCPCDWDHHGGLNSQDFFSFISAFFGGAADFNQSGSTDSQDFFDFLACFFGTVEGCV